MSNEITVKLKCSIEELSRFLESQDFKIRIFERGSRKFLRGCPLYTKTLEVKNPGAEPSDTYLRILRLPGSEVLNKAPAFRLASARSRKRGICFPCASPYIK